MRAPTHIAFGLLCTTSAFSLASLSLHQDLPALGATILGSLLPDIDSPQSTLGRVLPFLSIPLERRFGHRTVTHSLLALGSLSLALLPVGFLLKTLYAGLLIGYASHLLADFFTKSGVPLFYPHPSLCVLPANERYRIHTGSIGEGILFGILLLLLVLVFPLSRAGGVWKALRYLAATQGMAYREFREATTETRLEFAGHWRTSRQPVQGSALVLEANQSRFLIAFQGQVLAYGEQGDILPERSRIQVTGRPLQLDTLRVHRQGYEQLVEQLPSGAFVSGRLESTTAFEIAEELPSTQHEPIHVQEKALELAFAPRALLARLHPRRKVDAPQRAQLQTQVQDLSLDLEALQLQRPPVHYLKLRQAQARLQAKQRELAELQDTTVRFTGALYLRLAEEQP